MMRKRTFMKDGMNMNGKDGKESNGYADFGFHSILGYMEDNPMQEFITPVLHVSVKV